MCPKTHHASDSPGTIFALAGRIRCSWTYVFLTDSRGRAAVHKANWVEWYHTANAAQEIRPLKTRNWKMNSYFEGFLARHFLFRGERMQQRKRRNVKILDFKQSAIRKARFLACPKTKTQQWPSTDVVEKCGPAITQHLCTYSDSIVGRPNRRKWRHHTAQLYIRVHLRHTFLMPCLRDCQD